jgi:outer membrane protein assembly factor BamB
MVYIMSEDYGLVCIDASTGFLIWNNSICDGSITPTILNGKVYAHSRDNIYCFDALTGRKLLTFTTDAYCSALTIAYGRLYTGSFDDNMLCFNIKTGEKLWNFSIAEPGPSSPAVVDGKVYIGSDDRNIYCIDAYTGEKIWNYTTGEHGFIVSSPSVVDGKVYIGSIDNTFYCLNSTTGVKIWNYSRLYTSMGGITSSPSVADGRVYFGHNAVYCLKASTGAEIWKFSAGNRSQVYPEMYWSSPAVGDGKVFINSRYGVLYCLNALTGEMIWSCETGDDVTSSSISPVIVGGVVYFTSSEGFLYAFGEKKAGDWPTFHHDLNRSGTTSSIGPENNYTSWTFDTGRSITSSPAVVMGRIYLGCMDGKVRCLTASNGEPLWDFTGWWAGVHSPTLDDGKLFIGSSDYKVYCLDAFSGKYIWSYITEGNINSAPAVADGRVYIGSWDDQFYCLDASTGNLIWKIKTGYDIKWSSASVAGEKVYIGSEDHNLYCLDASTGEKIWNFTTGKYVHSSPTVIDRRVYLGSGDHKVYCLDSEKGTLIWDYTTYDYVLSSPAVQNDRVYIGSADKRIYCLNATSGYQIWSYETEGAVHSSPAVSGNKVYAGSMDGHIYCLDAYTGTLIWKYITGGAVQASPAIVDGTAYIGSEDGKIYAIGSLTYKLPVNVNGTHHDVSVVSNSRITDLLFDQLDSMISFVATGTPGTPASANITLPKTLLEEPYTLIQNDSPWTPTETANATHTSLYIEYINDVHTFRVIGTIISPGDPKIAVDPQTIIFPQSYPIDYPAILNSNIITNVGNGSLLVDSIGLTYNEGDTFSIDAILREGRLGALLPVAPPFLLDSGESAYIRVSWRPHDVENYRGMLRILSNDPGNPNIEVRMSGTGTTASGAGTFLTEQTSSSREPGEEGRWVLPLDLGAYITSTKTPYTFNVGEFSAEPTNENRGVILKGKLRHPSILGQLILEIKYTNSSEELGVYEIIVLPSQKIAETCAFFGLLLLYLFTNFYRRNTKSKKILILANNHIRTENSLISITNEEDNIRALQDGSTC